MITQKGLHQQQMCTVRGVAVHICTRYQGVYLSRVIKSISGLKQLVPIYSHVEKKREKNEDSIAGEKDPCTSDDRRHALETRIQGKESGTQDPRKRKACMRSSGARKQSSRISRAITPRQSTYLKVQIYLSYSLPYTNSAVPPPLPPPR